VSDSAAFGRFEAFRTSRWWFALADGLAMLLAILLPWSTSAFLFVVIPLWAIICGSVNVSVFLRSMARAPSLASLALFGLALAGVFWSEAGVVAGLHAVGPLLKFLLLPFFFYYFEVSGRGARVLAAFLFSCTLLMVYSWIVTVEPSLALKTGRCCGEDFGVPIRNYIDQSQEFGVCLVALLSAAGFCIERRMWRPVPLLALTAAGFAANLVFVVVSRTAIVCIPVMAAVVAWRHAGLRGVLALAGIGAMMLAAAWFASPHLRARIMSVETQYLEYEESDVPSSVGKRIEFWRKSLYFIREAPVWGHGTGSILQLFEQDAVGQSGIAAEVVANPHNQVLNVMVQWGAVGLVVLCLFWSAHIRIFLRAGLVAELGLIVIAQNITGSLFNSHLFDFTEGWLYVLGVGVAGGMLAKPLEGSTPPDRISQSCPSGRINLK
jgi:O-antigen ligase